MSRHHLRSEQTCANCGHQVEKRFCPDCGQENTETRQSFGHLVRHFVEDITHYDGGFWRTMRYLIARPAYLTKAFLAGKRNSFVPPVRLYIFISFVTFFLPHILPESDEELNPAEQAAGQHSAAVSDGAQPDSAAAQAAFIGRFKDVAQLDSFQRALPASQQLAPGTYQAYKAAIARRDSTAARRNAGINRFKTVAQLDSFQHSLPEAKKLPLLSYYFVRLGIKLSSASKHIDSEQLNEVMNRTMPKALFLYMPFFAFLLWLFHGKKRWLYFDHAIFTLHYFSFIMLLLCIWYIITAPIEVYAPPRTAELVDSLIRWIYFPWCIYYFFRAHHKMYQEHGVISALKAWPIALLAVLAFAVLLVAVLLFAISTIH